ncbi:ribulose-phosphate 3-epimerase [Buchnera aphidicola]|uniref:ribulose-phosphate 3-epimerase n=1 Tax=Buchnera aphidicola TaxID=9 RepID=UPI0031B8A6E8
MKKFFIAPSILSADFARLGENIQEVLDAGADMIHFDVMDNHYVPNLTFGPMVLQSLRKYKISSPIDVHLMVNSVDSLIPVFAASGADFITFHPETSSNINETLNLIKKYGCKAGLAVNPDTSIDHLKRFFNKLDLILLMSVNPGFPGQKFIPSVLNKIYQLNQYIRNVFPNILLEVDGGININNFYDIAQAGANILVMGSAIFYAADYRKTIQFMKSKLSILC